MTDRPDVGRAGVVVAGGRSTRFLGGDKALAVLDGEPLLGHVVAALVPVTDEVIVNCRRDQLAAFEAALEGAPVCFAPDPVSDWGPVAGLRTALAATDAEYAAVLGCDTPWVPPAFVSTLFERARGHTGAAVELDGTLQPLLAVVHVRACTAVCEDTLSRRSPRLRDVLAALQPRIIDEREALAHVDRAALRDVDTYAEFHEAAVEE